MHFQKNKILVRQIGLTPIAGIDEYGYPVLNSAFMIHSKEVSNFFLLGILNSKLIKVYWKNKFIDNRKTFPKIKGSYLKLIPIKNSIKYEIEILKLVENIIKKKKQSKDTTSLEQQIDNLVYNLYNLTYDEVLIIEPEFSERMSESKYEALEVE